MRTGLLDAVEKASSRNRAFVTPELLMDAIIEKNRRECKQLLHAIGCDANAFLVELNQVIEGDGVVTKLDKRDKVMQSPALIKAITAAASLGESKSHIGIAHFMAGVLIAGGSMICDAMLCLGAKKEMAIEVAQNHHGDAGDQGEDASFEPSSRIPIGEVIECFALLESEAKQATANNDDIRAAKIMAQYDSCIEQLNAMIAETKTIIAS